MKLRPKHAARRSLSAMCSLTVGDKVCVVQQVKVKGSSTLGWTGVVVNDAADTDADEWGCCQQVETDARYTVQLFKPVLGYFAEDELELVTRSPSQRSDTGVRFFEGDLVRVVDDVVVKDSNSKSEIGIVYNIWEICETDPACCCAELATDASIQVNMIERHPYDIETQCNGSESLTGYFTEEEIWKLDVV